MMKFLSLLLALLVVNFTAVAAPRPAVIQGPQEWTLDVEFAHLQQIMLRSQENSASERFWYVILTVTNNTGEDVVFYPQCDLMTDTFEIIPVGKAVPAEVFWYIKAKHARIYPFLEPLDASGMRILQGDDNTRDIAIVWRDFDKQANEVSIFISGLSNETAAVDIPNPQDCSEQPKKILLRKTLELDYTFSGDPAFRSNPNMTFEGKSWIMR